MLSFILYFFSNIENRCWLKKNLGLKEENFKFLLYEDEYGKLLSESEEEIAENIETIVKKNGFLNVQEYLTPNNLTIECMSNGQWEYVDSARYYDKKTILYKL